MGDFFKSSLAGGSNPGDQAMRKQQLMDGLRNEMALANAQELINKINEKCFAKCITKPSTSLGSSEERCLSMCMDRYMEAFNVISQTYVARISKERTSSIGGLE
ncbi:Mitochondrial import inner membrane translocase subunit Tim13 [Ceratobasidium sp. 392]|nr:Mitochondrial import inner membrane translocase subunit Tim13 [Ceratobasidium sp. 392]